jgi:uncharacterized protein YjbJ (UPF0337 family)
LHACQDEVRNSPWGNLTDDDLNKIEGNRTQSGGKIQKRCGIAKDQIRKDVDTWLDPV